MTYLFDAKYRIENQLNRVDYPPQDALNQMHRYRDAIYFGERANSGRSEQLKKEVIGGWAATVDEIKVLEKSVKK